jgi:hypothetical protein
MMSNADPTKIPGMNSNVHKKVRSYGFLQYSHRNRGKEQSTQKEKDPLAFEKWIFRTTNQFVMTNIEIL